MPESVVAGGKTLALNGAGVRTATMFKINVYVAALYTPGPVRDAGTALKLSGPLRFDFRFLRAVSREKVVRAWTWQFDQSAGHSYPGLKKDSRDFAELFEALKEGGLQTVEFEGDDSLVTQDGRPLGRVKGRDFQLAFLSLWFGENPPTMELKKKLLGG